MIYIFWTCASMDEAKSVVRSLLEKQLIACASMLPNVTSMFSWEGVIEESSEVKVILKTDSSQFDAIAAIIHDEGSYETPEIGAVDVAQVSPSYLAWLESIVK